MLSPGRGSYHLRGFVRPRRGTVLYGENMTTVINIKDAPADWEADDRYVYIGRKRGRHAGYWGNPFPVKGAGREKSLKLYAEYLKDRMAVKGFSVTRDKRNPLCVEDLAEPLRVKASKKVGFILEQIVVVPMFHGRGIGPNVS